MRIWIFNHYAVTPEQPGGTRHFDFAQELTRRGHQVTILTSGFLHHSREMRNPSGDEKWEVQQCEGVTMVWIRTTRYSKNDWRRFVGMAVYALRSVVSAAQIARRVGGAPDIVIGSTPHPFSALAAYVAAQWSGAAFLFEVRDLWPETFVRSGLMSARNPVVILLRFLERYLARHARKVILVPPSADSYYREMGIPGSKLVGLPNGVNLARWKAGESRDVQSNCFTIVYTGTLGATNGLDLVLQAAKALQERRNPRVAFRLVGDGTEKSHLMEAAKRLGLDNVQFRKAVPKKDVPRILREADAALHVEGLVPGLERYGSSPNKVYDYLASGGPLLISSPFLPELPGESDYALRAEPGNPASLADAVVWLSQQTEARLEQMRGHARRAVARTRSIEVLVDRLEGALLDLERTRIIS